MKLGWLVLIVIVLAGCSSPHSGDEDDGVVDLNHYQLYIVVVEEFEGEVVWEWAAVDEEFCGRHTVWLSIKDVEEQGDMIVPEKCSGSGNFQAEEDKIYEFQWDGIAEITYDIALN